MDKDRVKGKIDEVAGRTKRQAGEWTGDTQSQVEGGVQEIKGRVQNAWGKAKDAARDSNDTHKAPHPEHTEHDSGRH
ncbi:MAG TPA: CsbD family protein [Terracidiphilus sp.]|nr:CsbD family protein [Terracidiphilus sp.]